ncbi:Histone-lysine N-methyltransferase SUVR5 [Hordeum vulgare]|nr:Histone-lysine N-methyltransferase SUVR5 [Hordeum vulgare]
MPEYPHTHESNTINVDAHEKDGEHVPVLDGKRKRASFMDEELTIFSSMTEAVKEVPTAIRESKSPPSALRRCHGADRLQPRGSPGGSQPPVGQQILERWVCCHGTIPQDALAEDLAGQALLLVLLLLVAMACMILDGDGDKDDDDDDGVYFV